MISLVCRRSGNLHYHELFSSPQSFICLCSSITKSTQVCKAEVLAVGFGGTVFLCVKLNDYRTRSWFRGLFSWTKFSNHLIPSELSALCLPSELWAKAFMSTVCEFDVGRDIESSLALLTCHSCTNPVMSTRWSSSPFLIVKWHQPLALRVEVNESFSSNPWAVWLDPQPRLIIRISTHKLNFIY